MQFGVRVVCGDATCGVAPQVFDVLQATSRRIQTSLMRFRTDCLAASGQSFHICVVVLTHVRDDIRNSDKPFHRLVWKISVEHILKIHRELQATKSAWFKLG